MTDDITEMLISFCWTIDFLMFLSNIEVCGKDASDKL